ncbi:MAG: PAS domain-containing protein [Acidobacteria bacterium]|nr:PAS domain-containing protein [Acidobacteriota bacterium]
MSGPCDLALAILDGAIEGVIIVNEGGGRIRYANASAGRMFGESPQGMLRLTLDDLHPDEDRTTVRESFKAFYRGDIKLAAAVPCQRRDGSRFWADISGARLVLKNMRCIIGFFTDVSGQKAARDAAVEAQALSASVFNAVPDILGIQDMQHGIIRYNEAGYRFLNTDADGVQGRKCYELIGQAAPCVQCATSETYRTRKPAQLEKFVESLGIWLDVRSYPIFDQYGNLKGIVEHLRDITLEKRAEAEMLRTEKLSSLAILAGGIAHDFNNLLGGIYGNLEMARAVSHGQQEQAFLDATLKTMGRARALTQQLLTFAKGGAPVRKVALLEDFLSETVSFACSGSRVSCTLDIEAGLWASNYDADQIAQVIDNILINAQQAMPAGGLVTVTARNVTIGEGESPALAPGRYVRLSIRDQGMGIPREHLSRIFDPFFTTKQQGSGLGLATSFSIIGQHGGLIQAESEPGKGSQFHIFLLACDRPSLSAPESAPRQVEGSGRILVMDDEAMLRETIGAMLQHHGYEAVLAADGAEALRIFDAGVARGAPFAAVILDLTVSGGMGGRETIAELRKKDRDIPVFVASGYASDPILARPQDYGFTDSIAKPFTRKGLIEILCKYL